MATRAFDGNIITGEGVALGGDVHVEVSDNGDWFVKFHVHTSSILANYDYLIRAYLKADGLPPVAFVKSGHCSGVDDWNHEERGTNPLLRAYWDKVQSGDAHLEIAIDWEWSGIIGDVGTLLEDIGKFVIGAPGFALGTIIAATSEAVGWLGAALGPGVTLGIVSGMICFLIPGGALFAVPVGIAVGAVTSLEHDWRPLNDEERKLAREVFGDSLDFERIRLTDLIGLGDRPFTAPGIEGITYVNLGEYYHRSFEGYGPYSEHGQLLVHELVHAWQIQHGFVPEVMCSGVSDQIRYIFDNGIYAYDAKTLAPWDDLNNEQQGAAVDQWFGGNGAQANYQQEDQQSPFYRYIRENVLGGGVSPTSRGTLRSSSSTSVGAATGAPHRLHVAWASSDGSVRQHHYSEGKPNGNEKPASWNELPRALAPAGSAAAHAQVALAPRLPGLVNHFWISTDGSVVCDGSSIAGAGSAHADGKVAAVARTPDNLDVFWINPDGSVWTHWWHAAPENDWKYHAPFPVAPAGSAQPGGGLGVVARRADQLDVFWIGPDGAIGTTWWNPTSGWGKPYPITPPGAARDRSPVAVTSRMPEHIDVFWVGRDGAVGAHWWDDAPKCGWGDHQPYAISAPGATSPTGGLAACSRNPQQMDVFWVGADGAIGTNWWNAASNWGQPFAITTPGSADPASGVSAVGRRHDHLDVFWRSPNDRITSHWWNAAAGQGWGDHQPFTIDTKLMDRVKDDIGDVKKKFPIEI